MPQPERNQGPVETLQGLIKVPSYSEQEGPIQAHILQTLTEAALSPFLQDQNVVLKLPGIDHSRALIFNSHVDVVDAGDESRWAFSPWSGEVHEGRIYGRGASDMKIGAAATIEVAKSLAARLDLPYDVWFTYVVREEVDGAGTQSFADWFKAEGYPEQYEEVGVVFTEPTDLDMLEYGHRGNFFIRASLDGDAGHASNPQNIKRHAILEMMDFIRDLESESSVWADLYRGGEFKAPTITPTSIEAKSGSPNKVADHAEATFDLRTIPDFHQEAFQEVRTLAEKRGISLSLIYPESPTGFTDPNARIIRVFRELVPDLRIEVSQASADLGFMTSLGVQGVIFGPGEKAQMHEIDESAPIDHLDRAITIYTRLIEEWGRQ